MFHSPRRHLFPAGVPPFFPPNQEPYHTYKISEKKLETTELIDVQHV